MPSHHGVLCIGDFGVALFDTEDLPFLADLHAHRASPISASLLIERYAAADPVKAETRTIVDFMAARDRLTRSGVLVELAPTPGPEPCQRKATDKS